MLFKMILTQLIHFFDSVKPGDLIEHDKHCKLHVCCNSCTVFFQGHLQKKGVSPAVNRLV